MGPLKVDAALSSEEVAVILDAVADGVFTVDGAFRISAFSRAAEAMPCRHGSGGAGDGGTTGGAGSAIVAATASVDGSNPRP